MSLELAAKFLGDGYKVDRLISKPIGAKEFVEKYHVVNAAGFPLTDDELCMALLRRAVELDMAPDIHGFKPDDWYALIAKYEGSGPTPLAAVLAAVAQLEGV